MHEIYSIISEKTRLFTGFLFVDLGRFHDLIPLGEVMLRMDILVMVELEPQDPSRFVKVVVSIML